MYTNWAIWLQFVQEKIEREKRFGPNQKKKKQPSSPAHNFWSTLVYILDLQLKRKKKKSQWIIGQATFSNFISWDLGSYLKFSLKWYLVQYLPNYYLTQKKKKIYILKKKISIIEKKMIWIIRLCLVWKSLVSQHSSLKLIIQFL